MGLDDGKGGGGNWPAAGVKSAGFSSRFPCESWSHQTSAYRQLKQRPEPSGEPRLLHDVQAQSQVPDQVRNGHRKAGVNLRKRPGCEAGVCGVGFSSRFPCESRHPQTSSYREGKASHGPKSRLGHRPAPAHRHHAIPRHGVSRQNAAAAWMYPPQNTELKSDRSVL
ncbi:uncharacterized protein LOC119432922 [Dermacentor silvarum]|uniref:uncharacterized protein LOC119432922 n=1 Tax=Dermacentor silvarum TaxID=543639 RepID=UPI00210156CC|nr:uncharacterized protein LOC119432922 [Dermacentor silvarum]